MYSFHIAADVTSSYFTQSNDKSYHFDKLIDFTFVTVSGFRNTQKLIYSRLTEKQTELSLLISQQAGITQITRTGFTSY